MRERTLPGAAALFALMVFAVSMNTLPVTQLRIAGVFHIPVEAVIRNASIQFIGFMLATVFLGVLSDHIGKRLIFAAGAVLMAIGAAVCAAAPNAMTLTVGCLLMGMGGGVMEGLSCALLSDLFPERRNFLLNISQIFYCFGAICWPLLIAAWLPSGACSWRVFFWAIAGMGLALLVLFLLSKMPRPAPHERIDAKKFRAIVFQRAFFLPCAMLFLYVLAENAVLVEVTPYLFKELGAPETRAIQAVALFWAAMTLGRFGCAVVPDKRGPDVILILSLLSAITLALQLATGDWRVSMLLFTLTGLTYAGLWPMIVTLAAAENPRYSGTAVGITAAAGSMGCVVAPPLMGLLFEMAAKHAISPRWVMAGLALPLVLTAFFTYLVIRSWRKV